MIYAYDKGILLPISSIYDTQMMLAQVAAAKDMYEKAAQEMKDFKKEYGDFYSPFSKDMQRYSEMVGGVQKIILDAYDQGIDPTRSSEGRAAIRRAINSIDTGEYNAMKANAKIGYAYLDAMQKLRLSGKYSEALELFDIALTGGTNFSDFATTRNSDGSFSMWNRVSPIEATSLRDLTYKSYEHRTPRDLTKEDFANDPALRGMTFDPRYQYTGYLDSDLMKIAPGASASLAGDPRAAFFRDQARLKVAASGAPVTDEAVEAQFQRDIADANKWALVDPTKKVDEYAMQALRTADAIRLEGIRAKNDENIARIKASGNGSGGNRYSPTMNMVVDSEGKLKGLLSYYLDENKNKQLQERERAITLQLKLIAENPLKYSKKTAEYWVSEYNKAQKNREVAGIEGVAKEVNKIKSEGTYFTDTPETINGMLRNLSSQGISSTLVGFLRNLGGNPGSNGGTHVDRQRLCGVGEVMRDVLSRGVANGESNKTIERAIKRFDNASDLGQYNVSWTSGAFDIRNETNDGGWWNHNGDEMWPTGNVVSGKNYYYIEVANHPDDYDESCWFKIERDVLNNGGINPTISSVVEYIDDAYTHEFSHTNIIGNQLSAVQGYNE